MTRRTLSLPRSERWARLAAAAGGVLDRGARVVQHLHATAARREGRHGVARQRPRSRQRSREVRVGDAPLKPASKDSIDFHECMSMGLHHPRHLCGVQSRGEAMLPLMNTVAFDAMTQHWEFAYGAERVRKLAAGLTYPTLAINIHDEASGRLAFEPSCVVERAGLRVGTVGIASNIVDKSMPASYSQGLRFTLGNTELPGHIERLRSVDKVDLVVVLSHLGFAQDAQLAAELPGGDVGHELICVDERIEPDAEMTRYRAAMLGEQGVPQKYGSKRQKLEVDAVESLRQLFARGAPVRGLRRGSVAAV
jgi:hypothetical protein